MAYFYKGKELSDKKKIKAFLKSRKCVCKDKGEIQYPVFLKQTEDDISTTFVYRSPLGVPSQLIQKLAQVLEEGLYKPVMISFQQRELFIRVFQQCIPEKWHWSNELLREKTWDVIIGRALDRMIYHDFEKHRICVLVV